MNLESKYSYALFVLMASLILGMGCETKSPSDLTDHNLIPIPVEITSTQGWLAFGNANTVYTEEESLNQVSQYLIDEQANLAAGTSTDATIVLSMDANDAQLGSDGYQIKILENQINISGNEPSGVFNGVQTLLQLLPISNLEGFELATGTIRDYPRYAHRGAMLDVSRHFFGVDEVKRYIDFLAAYKMNVLHLHLTDDQGWRIEIKAKPELTNIGSTTEVGGGEGGFYNQEQYKEIIQYAADRYITVIPEIDMPGHTQAALASYAELNCDGKAGELYTGTEVGFSTFCTDSEATYEFIDVVIQELAAITPGKYIHIGGDESHATKKEDYIYFVNRVQKIVSKYNKVMLGWDEIAQCEIEKETMVQQWNSAGNATLAAAKGNKIILSPAKRAYLDMKYDTTSRIGYTWASLIPVDYGYNWDPDTINADVPVELIHGIEAPLWTETVENMDDIEYLVFPRLPGYAEIAWSPQSLRNWETYKNRLAAHGDRFKAKGIDFYPSPLINWSQNNVTNNDD